MGTWTAFPATGLTPDPSNLPDAHPVLIMPTSPPTWIRVLVLASVLLLTVPERGSPLPAPSAPAAAPDLPTWPTDDLSRAPILLAEARAHPDRDERIRIFESVEALANERLAQDPDDMDARWWRVAVWGLRVDEESARGMVRYARAAYEDARWILERDPDHPGAHHVMGRLHAGILRVNRVVRFFAQRLVGDEELRNASWESAEGHLRRAVEGEPHALYHRIELILVLDDRGKAEEARAEYEAMMAMDDTDPMDPVVRQRARVLWGDDES